MRFTIGEFDLPHGEVVLWLQSIIKEHIFVIHFIFAELYAVFLSQGAFVVFVGFLTGLCMFHCAKSTAFE